ncbi:hypothetical protein SLA2020_270080 [Shorea laevis]
MRQEWQHLKIHDFDGNVDSTNFFAWVKSLRDYSDRESIPNNRNLIMAKTVMEGNVKALKEILISFKMDIDRCLQQLELGQPFGGGGRQVGPTSSQPQKSFCIGESNKSVGPMELGLSGITKLSNATREDQHHTQRFSEMYHRRTSPRPLTQWRVKQAVVDATTGSRQFSILVEDPVASVVEDGNLANGEEDIPSNEGFLRSALVPRSSKQQGESSEPRLCTKVANEMPQGGTEGGAPAGTSSMSTLALYPHSPTAKGLGKVGGSFQWNGYEGMGVDVLEVVKASHQQRWNLLEGVPRLLRREVVDGDNDSVEPQTLS